MSDKKKEMNPYEIAVIGYTQAGKTVLAVGLYATSTAEFTVTGKGEETVDYLKQRKAILESGEWVDPTLEGEVLNLQLVINRRGERPAGVVFQEYMGERASINQETYKEEVVGNPRAVMILMNPKMEILRDAWRRNEMIGQIKDIISYLSGPGMRCEHVAFVITAADLLTTSLKDYKEEFDGYKEEITNCLNTNPKFQNAWKEFEVTVTGPLEDPEHPRIARADGNTSRKPFEWLIEQIDKADAKKRISKIGHRIVTLLLLGCIVFSGYHFYIGRVDENKYRMLLKEFRELKVNAETKATARNIKDFSNKVTGWEPRTEKGREYKRSLVVNFNGNKLNMRQQYNDKYAKDESVAFETNAEKFINRLGNAALNLDDGPSINEVLVECKRYEKWAQTEGAKPEVDFETRKETWEKIKQGKGKEDLLDKLLTNQIGRLGSDGTVSKKDEEFLERTLLKDGALSEEEYNDWMNKLKQAEDNKREGWVLAQDGKCDEFIAKIRNCTGITALGEYKKFSRENPNAPKLDSVAAAVSDIVIKDFQQIYMDTLYVDESLLENRRKQLKETYQKLKELALKAAGNSMERDVSFKKTRAYNFAWKLLNENGVSGGGVAEAFKQKYIITRITAKADDDSFCKFSKYGKVFIKPSYQLAGELKTSVIDDCEPLVTADNHKPHKEVWNGRVTIEGTPWSEAILYLDSVGGTFDAKGGRKGSCVLFKNGENYKTENGYVKTTIKMNNDVTVEIRIYVQGFGTDFFTFADQYLFKGGK